MKKNVLKLTADLLVALIFVLNYIFLFTIQDYFCRCNFSDMEIEMFFAKYDLDGDGIFSMDEGAEIINDLEYDNIDREVGIMVLCRDT